VLAPALEPSVSDWVAKLSTDGRLTMELLDWYFLARTPQVLGDLVSSEGLLDFLRTGGPPDADSLATPGALSPDALGNVWRVYLNSELGIARFFLDVPVDKPRQENFRLQFCLRDWTWKLCGIELPQALQVRLAQEVANREPSRPRS